MSSNVGLTTPRGSGTSGYVQRNLSHLRPRDDTNRGPNAYGSPEENLRQYRQRQPDAGILEHDRKREIEVKVFELRDRMEDAGAEDDDIEDACTALRAKLVAAGAGAGAGEGRKLKSHQVHELAQAKIVESERLRRALGISKDYEEGGHWKRKEEMMREREAAARVAGEGHGAAMLPPAGGGQRERVGRDTRERPMSRSRSRSPRRSYSRSRSRSGSED